jgi:5-methylthioadenosine/S-adenosylhomocysteine deaminase
VTATLVRSRTLITGAEGRDAARQIDNGALLIEDGMIAAIGDFDTLKARNPSATVVGSGNDVVLPGFVNGHHHVGLTPLQLGSPDMPLELWFVTRMVTRNLNLYLDTLYSAFEMIGSGITTVQHIHGWLPGPLEQVKGLSEEVIRAYEDIGMRVSYCYAVRDQNRLVYQADEDFTASLPKELQDPMKRWFDRFKVGLDDSIALFRDLHAAHNHKRRVRIQLAPANLHWCSDAALTALSETSKKYDAPLHMHLLETAYQKEYAARRGGCTAVDYIERFDMLGPRLTLGHGVWLNESDMDKLAASGSCVCHNCSSNFRLRSGIAALNHLEAKGINTAIGLDEAGLNDDRDMLNEMRLVSRVHRVPGHGRGRRAHDAAGAAHGDRGRGAHDLLRGHHRAARGGPGGRSRDDRLGACELPLSRPAGLGARRRDPARQDPRRDPRDLRRRDPVRGRPLHARGPRRRAQGAARRSGACPVRRRGPAPRPRPAASPACAPVLRRLHRPLPPRALLPAKLARLTGA